MKPVIYVVVPCYNEEAALPRSVGVLLEELERIGADEKSRLLLVDDGSRDATWRIIEDFHRRDGRVCGLKLAHNAGQQNAMWAGMMEARSRADAVITIDCDLQDDPKVMRQLVEKFMSGCDVVYGVRSSRDKDTVFKRLSAHAYYSIMKMLGVELVYDHSEYRLLSRRALDALSQYGEVNLFLRAMVPTLGFRSDKVYYERQERVAGESKYPLSKMVSLAMQGITSFSDRPLAWVLAAGVMGVATGLFALLVAAVCAMCGVGVGGWAWVLMALWTMGGVQVLAIGLVGSYVGKIYMETKRRPRYIVDVKLEDGETDE